MPVYLSHCLCLCKLLGVIIKYRFEGRWEGIGVGYLIVDGPVAFGDCQAVEVLWMQEGRAQMGRFLMNQIICSLRVLHILHYNIAGL